MKTILSRLAVILLAGVAVTAIVCLPHVSSEIIRDFGIQGVKPEFAVFSLVILAPWAFVGFEITTFETAHFRFDARKSKGIFINKRILRRINKNTKYYS